MELLQELQACKKDHERRMKLTTRFSFLIEKAIEQLENAEKESLQSYQNGYKQGRFDEQAEFLNRNHEDFE